MEFKQIAVERAKQYTVNSFKTNSTNSKQYTVLQTRDFVENLDARLYKAEFMLPFYCKAARSLGFSRVLELQRMVTTDPRINGPLEDFNPEKVFYNLLKEALALKRHVPETGTN